MSKVLIVHPKDSSTSFLDIVYNPIPDKTIVTGGVSRKELVELIKRHDRVIMCGHGSPSGLFSMGQFDGAPGYIIDQEMVEHLRGKKDNIFIWCNSDVFVNRYELEGFYTGMFISEVGEATYCGLPGTPQDIVDESNYGFCEIISEYINNETDVIHENVTKEYGMIAEENPVALYNNRRLYKRLPKE